MQDQPSGHQTGQLVGNYRIVRKLGEGGMGVVYEGLHEQIGRRVAIKMLHPDLSRHADTVSRFLTEARLVSRLQHPGVVYTFEYGQLPDQTAYIVMEYLQGESLATRLKASGGRLGGTAVNVARQIASALATAHEQGIVHRVLFHLSRNPTKSFQKIEVSTKRAGKLGTSKRLRVRSGALVGSELGLTGPLAHPSVRSRCWVPRSQR